MKKSTSDFRARQEKSLVDSSGGAFMRFDHGIYITLSPQGVLRRQLVSASGEIDLEETTPEAEIINYSELSFEPYAAVIDLLSVTAAFLPAEEDEHTSAEEKNVFPYFWDTVQDLVETFEAEDPLHGTLTRSALEDCVPPDDMGSPFIHQTAENILETLTEIMQFQFIVNEILYDMRSGTPIDLEEKYAFLRRAAVMQILELGDELTQRYFFRSPAAYYCFLLLHVLARKPRVCLCECCGRYFIPQRKGRIIYCARILKEDKTCKYWGPILKHKLKAQEKTVIEEFDRAKQRMYKRYDRTEHVNQKPSPKALSYDDYYVWLDRATKARDDCLAGKITLEDARKIINMK